MITDYKQYSLETRVMIISTGDHGEAYESLWGTISVFVDGEKCCRYFNEDDVVFLDLG